MNYFLVLMHVGINTSESHKIILDAETYLQKYLDPKLDGSFSFHFILILKKKRKIFCYFPSQPNYVSARLLCAA